MLAIAGVANTSRIYGIMINVEGIQSILIEELIILQAKCHFLSLHQAKELQGLSEVHKKERDLISPGLLGKYTISNFILIVELQYICKRLQNLDSCARQKYYQAGSNNYSKISASIFDLGHLPFLEVRRKHSIY